jgi:hypothetical protein
LKLRIHDNSIRLRLNRHEVAQFLATGRVEDAVHFAAGVALSYSMETSASASAPQAIFSDGNLRVIVPSDQGRNWATSDQIGMEAQDAHPAILVEKDFQCMHRDEHDPEAYPNPLLN